TANACCHLFAYLPRSPIGALLGSLSCVVVPACRTADKCSDPPFIQTRLDLLTATFDAGVLTPRHVSSVTQRDDENAYTQHCRNGGASTHFLLRSGRPERMDF